MAGNAKQAGSSLKRRNPGLQARVSDNGSNDQEENVMKKNTTVVDMRKFVEARNGRAFTTSQQVAEAFGKLHNHVMARVRTLECSDQFLTDNFSSVQFEHRGNTYDACEMTKDGFMFLVMGFTGKAAAAIKESYIAAFNSMAEQLGLSAEQTVSTLVGDVIGSTGEVVLSRVIEQKGYLIAPSLQRSFAHTMKSRLRSRFNVQKTSLIPADQMADACNFVAAYALEGEWIESQQADPIPNLGQFDRYMVSLDPQGKRQVEAIPMDACVMSRKQLMKAIVTPGEMGVSTEEMFNFLTAVTENLRMRSLHRARRTAA